MNNQIILFDGVCNLCNSSVNIIIRNDKKRIFRFVPLQSVTGKKIADKFRISENKFDSVILIQNNKLFIKSSAALEISKQLKFPINFLIILRIFPKFLLDKIYDFIAANRYTWFGKREECVIPSPETRDIFIE